MPDVSFSDWVSGLSADTLTGPEKFPLVDGTSSLHVTASALAAFVIDQLHQASVITTVADADELNVFQSDVEKVLTAQNFFNWVVDKLEAIETGTTIISGDKLVFSDGGVLKQIDIDNVKAFLESSVVSLGTEIATLSAATLADSDQYVVSQTTTARKTTFAAIAARVHSQFLTYVASLPTVATLASADTFYVNDSGVASKVTASTIATYIQAQVGPGVVSAAWDTYSALGAAANATDVFLLERSGTGRTATGANLATYIVGTQNSAADAVSTVAGDDLLIFRSGTQYKLDVGLLSTYVIASGWSATSGNPVATGDKIIIGRGGVTYSVTVDQLRTFALVGIQASVLDLTGLTSANLDATDIFLVGEGSAARKATLTELETKLWTDFQTYVSGLTALTSLEDADTFYVIDGGVPKKITGANIASYVETELWDKVDASPTIQAGDDIWMRRAGVTYKLDVDALATYVNSAIATNINVSALSAATLDDTDVFLVDEGASNTKVTLANLKTHFWTAFATYVSGLTAASVANSADNVYLISGGTPFKSTLSNLWDMRFSADAKLIKLDDFAAPDDSTDLDATVARHGLLRKLNGSTSNFLRGDGTWATPAGAGDMVLSGVQTVTGAKTFGSAGAVGKLIIAGSTSGSTILDATPVAGSGTVTLPTTGTLVTLAGTESLTNKTLTTPVITGLPTGSGVAATSTASTLVSRDSNANVTSNNFIEGYATTATAGATTTLTASSARIQIFTGSTTQTVTLPVTSTLALGFTFRIVNNSAGAVTVNSSGANAVLVMRPGSEAVFTCVLTSGTTAASWIQNQITTKSIPQNSQSAAYTTTISDANCHIYHPSADVSARTWTIDSNANVPYPIGTQLTFVNDTSAGTVTIAITSDTLVLAGAGTTGSRTLAANGIATAIKMTATRWMISGTGLT